MQNQRGLLNHMNGKGDKDRTSNNDVFNKNFDEIDWGEGVVGMEPVPQTVEFTKVVQAPDAEVPLIPITRARPGRRRKYYGRPIKSLADAFEAVAPQPRVNPVHILCALFQDAATDGGTLCSAETALYKLNLFIEDRAFGILVTVLRIRYFYTAQLTAEEIRFLFGAVIGRSETFTPDSECLVTVGEFCHALSDTLANHPRIHPDETLPDNEEIVNMIPPPGCPVVGSAGIPAPTPVRSDVDPDGSKWDV